ncbi:MAG: serine hydrolase [Chitinophagaceae bacterium]|nr:serine hydrolase [Chitinophagaceae bacterium]
MKRVLFSLLSFLLILSSNAQTSTPAFVKDSLDSYITRALAAWQIPGISICIIKDGKAVLLKGYGEKETGTSAAVDENTLFMIGSNTKAFTATALAMLEGIEMPGGKRFSLNDKVQQWLPSFKLHDPWVASETNIRDLLCHRLGFETFQGDFMFFDSDLSAQQVLEKFGKLKPKYSFRSRWGYTNAAFAVAGEVLQQASGKTWSALLEEKLFRPLGMINTIALSSGIASAANKAAAHTVAEGKLKKIAYGNIDNMSPAGSISSSAADLSKWLIAQLDNGRINGKQVIPASAIAQTRFPHSILGNGGPMFNTGHFSLYGLGWLLEEYAGKKIVSHTGGVNGFVTGVTLVPEEKLGIVVLTNTDANNFYEALKQEILDAYLGLPYRNYSQLMLSNKVGREASEKKQQQLKMNTIASKPATGLPLKAYAGEYEHNVYGKMMIDFINEKLVARFEHHTGRFAELAPLGGNRFLASFNDPLFGVKVWPFKVESGNIRSVIVSVADFVEFTPYEFLKLK